MTVAHCRILGLRFLRTGAEGVWRCCLCRKLLTEAQMTEHVGDHGQVAPLPGQLGIGEFGVSDVPRVWGQP